MSGQLKRSVLFPPRYRSPDGSCNSPSDSRYGMALTALNRILPPRYADGVDQPRKSVTGSILPSARWDGGGGKSTKII